MSYNVFIGFMSSFDFKVLTWIYIIVGLILLNGAIAALIYNFLLEKTLKDKILILTSYLLIGLLFFGVFGLVVFSFVYFICFAFLSDFINDY
jgi:hypothetical protein